MKNEITSDKETEWKKLIEYYLFKNYGVSLVDIINSRNKTQSELQKNVIENGFPIKILTQKLSSLEAIVKYLRENKKLSYEELGKLLSRNPRTLAVTYAVARKKQPEMFSEDVTKSLIIPFEVFNIRLSVLESISKYLHDVGYTYSDIGRMLDKDPRTIWTVCRRSELKLKHTE